MYLQALSSKTRIFRDGGGLTVDIDIFKRCPAPATAGELLVCQVQPWAQSVHLAYLTLPTTP